MKPLPLIILIAFATGCCPTAPTDGAGGSTSSSSSSVSASTSGSTSASATTVASSGSGKPSYCIGAPLCRDANDTPIPGAKCQTVIPGPYDGICDARGELLPMSRHRLVFVSNIPVRTSVQGWVRIPDDIPPELMQASIRLALDLHGYQPSGKLEVLEACDVDKEAAFDGKWEALTPREPK